MEGLKEFVRAVFADQATDYLIALLFLLTITSFVLGTLRAFASGQFDVSLWDTFVRADVAGRVLPLTIVLVLGRVVAVGAPGVLEIPGLNLSVLTGAGAIAAVPYVVGKIQSIIANVNPSATDTPPARE